MSFLGDPLRGRSAEVPLLASIPGFNHRLASDLHAFLRGPTLGDAEREADRQLSSLHALGGALLHLWDARYPARLAAIYDAPPILYVRGEVAVAGEPCVAVVGTRRPSAYGLVMAEYFARELASAGVTVVSGLARGVDTRAHAAALAAGGKTIGVIGTGLDRCYPAENRRLAADIAASGIVASECPPGTGPEPSNFPRRNRIISGLSLGTIVVESDTDGGALITAYLALDQNREVFAVPGTVHSRKSRGCHALIREGKAKLVECIDDILAEISQGLTHRAGAPQRHSGHAVSLPPGLRKLADLLGLEPVHIDDLAGRSGLPIPDLLVSLLDLEMKNLVRQLPGKYFIRQP